MVILPAIDLRGGRVVRLRQGDPGAETIYGDDPAAMARRWASAGAEWLHVVDLDGAFGGQSANVSAIRAIVAAAGIPCELGGGIRGIVAAAKLLSLGVERVVFGTVAISEPEVVARAIERFGPAHVVVGLDARDGRVAVRGWTETSDVPAVECAARMKELGVERIVYTDIRRDGMSAGPNIAATLEISRSSGLAVIASGGIRSVADVERIARHEADGIEGAIIGRALYDESIRLEDAIAAARVRVAPADRERIDR